MKKQKENKEDVTLDGTLAYVKKKNRRTGWASYAIHTRTQTRLVMCEGPMLDLARFSPVIVKGHWNGKRGFGRVFLADSCTLGSCYRENAVFFLACGQFKGMGDKTAEKLVDQIGFDLFQAGDRPDLADEIRRVLGKGKKAERLSGEIAAYLSETAEQRKLMDLLTGYGLGYDVMDYLWSKYKKESMDVLRRSPFSVAEDCDIPFALSDRIWKDSGGSVYDTDRLKGLIREAMRRAESGGNTYLPLHRLTRGCQKISDESGGHADIPDVCILDAAIQMDDVVLPEDGPVRIASRRMDRLEQTVAVQIRRLTRTPETCPLTDDVISRAERGAGVVFGADQRRAMQAISASGLSIIEGRPGAGKTTMIRGLVAAYLAMYPTRPVYLCAPTGRAARRLTESTGYNAQTVHKLLNLRPDAGWMQEQTVLDRGLVVIDEATMVDTELMAMLLRAVTTGSCVIMVGDPAQLPSVGAGNILADLSKSSRFPVYELTQVYRQAEQSLIVRNAGLIREGRVNLLTDDVTFSVRHVDTCLEAAQGVGDFISSLSESELADTQVLSTVRKDPDAGVDALNERIQAIIPPAGPDTLVSGKTIFRQGDRVLFLKNNYKKGYRNGDIGVIEDICAGSLHVRVEDDGLLEVSGSALRDVSLGYAVTVHKSQGSEWGTVLVVLPDQPSGMLVRNLITTALTRARQRVIVFSVGDALERGIRNNRIAERHTYLKERIAEEIRKEEAKKETA